VVALLALGAALLVPGALPAQSDAPRALVEQVTARLVEAASGRGSALREDPARVDALADELIAPAVDFEAIARRVAARHWRQATPEQRARFAAEYRRFILRSLATAFVEHLEKVPRYAARLSYLPTRWGAAGDTAAVRGRLGVDSGLTLELEFQMHAAGGAWRVYDVAVAGVSLVQANQAAFARELEEGGIDGLTLRLAAHNRAHGADGASVRCD
jgi:phospholipid transport system substrate-binding protein